MAAKSGHRLIRLNTMLVILVGMYKVLRGDIEPSVSVLDRFVKWLDGDLVNWFHVSLEKAYSDNLVSCPVALTPISKAGATSRSWHSESKGEVEDGPFTSIGSRFGGKASHHRRGERNRGLR